MGFHDELKLAKEYKDPMVLLNMLPGHLKTYPKHILTLLKKTDYYTLAYCDGESVAYKKEGQLLEILQLMLAHLKSGEEL